MALSKIAILRRSIRRDFKKADELTVLGRNYNFANSMEIAIGDSCIPISFWRVAQVVGITPKRLHTVFYQRRMFVGKRNSDGVRELVNVGISKHVRRYADLGTLPMHTAPFIQLSKLFNKRLRVLHQNGGKGEPYHCFSVTPMGEVIPPSPEIP